jgi:hypothetical protein
MTSVREDEDQMRRAFVLSVICAALLTATTAAADEPSTTGSVALPTVAAASDTRLAESIARAATRLTPSPGPFRIDQEPPPHSHGWIGRHSILFGALVGAGAGAVASVTMENELFCSRGDEDCLFHGSRRAVVGAGIGAGIGALVGVLADAVRR